MISGPWNVNRGSWNVVKRQCNVIMGLWNGIGTVECDYETV